MTAVMPHGTLTDVQPAAGDLLLDPFALESDGTVLVPTVRAGHSSGSSVLERFVFDEFPRRRGL